MTGRPIAPIASRKSDELLLTWVRLRASGVKPLDIARRYGVTQDRVRSATNLILNADIKESREPRKDVQSAYWS